MKPKVLIVDDDQAVLQLTAELVARAGGEVMLASTVAEAVASLEGESIELLVTDYGLGEETGEDVVLALNRLQPSVPVVVITGNSGALPGWMREAGVLAGVFAKPYPPQPFLDLVGTILGVKTMIGKPNPILAAGPLPQGIEEMVHRVVDQESIVAITDKKGTIVYANDRFCEISGYARTELLGRNHRLLKSGQHPPSFYKGLWNTILSGRVWRGELCNRAKDGRLYYVDTVISPLRTEGLISHFIALRTDITARKEMERALAEQQRQEEENRRLASLGRMANGFLHDLNNILTGVMGLASESGSADRDALLHDAIGRMVQLTRTLRDYSTGRPAKPESFLLNPLVSCACSLVRHRREVPPGLTIEEHLSATRGLEVLGNEGQIFEVVLNLVVNAMEALAATPKPRIVVNTERHEGLVGVRVLDNGSGIPVDLARNIFDPYTSSKGLGRGVGLSVSKRIAVAHRGELRLVHRGGDGMGACFLLLLPAEATVDPRPSDGEKDKASRVVLVSEDEADVRRLIAREADSVGLRAINAGDTADLVALAAQMKEVLAAAIIDSCEVESEQGAVACLRRIRPDLPIILISAKLESRGRRVTPWGEVENLPKPFAAEVLAKALGAAVSVS